MPTPTTQPTEPLTEERLAAIEARCAAATPADTITFARYDHGGGRAYVDGQVGARQLVLDVYDEVNREFYYAARTDVSDLVAEVRRLRTLVGADVPTAWTRSYYAGRLAGWDLASTGTPRTAILTGEDAEGGEANGQPD